MSLSPPTNVAPFPDWSDTASPNRPDRRHPFPDRATPPPSLTGAMSPPPTDHIPFPDRSEGMTEFVAEAEVDVQEVQPGNAHAAPRLNWTPVMSTFALKRFADLHYKEHTKDHPKDVEYLNIPINNYFQMQIIFRSGIATGKFAMGSNEALGQPYVDPETIDVDVEAPPPQSETAAAATGDKKDKVKSDATSLKKMKRAAADDSALISGLTNAI
ncbi:hypothetical protein PR202_ga17573 [Eleusine coracana subsp. coracana]|uniref:Uncharacterized protein n=1 Tax=Eleusine coracana subsp. coracana TaxID=191504 RepID=A0AAV5CQJ1_ELECO|nr:hypothetical protein PR202_ga17326 [Eleusine coracana subsp. coracana]GJN00394.1 hypothetical protein PR202_ga17573 [Eleusine coracana subsp. coracana]